MIDPAGLTVEQLRARIETSAGNELLASLLAAAWSAIARDASPAGPTAELLRARGPLLMLSRAAASVTSVTEHGRTLTADDYELRPGGQLLVRRRASRWHGEVDVAYIAADDLDDRARVQAALVALELDNHPGITAVRIGEWSESYAADTDYASAREAILASLGSSFVLL